MTAAEMVLLLRTALEEIRDEMEGREAISICRWVKDRANAALSQEPTQ